MFSAQFLSEVVACALDIACHARNEDHLQSCDVLYGKFVAECKELAEAEVIWDEIPDVCYYALCLAAQGENYALSQVEYEILPRYKISEKQAEAATLAKYRRRAAGEPKNVEAERAARMAAIR